MASQTEGSRILLVFNTFSVAWLVPYHIAKSADPTLFRIQHSQQHITPVTLVAHDWVAETGRFTYYERLLPPPTCATCFLNHYNG